MTQLLLSTQEALAARGFEAHVFASAQDAVSFIRADMPEGADVGAGGSMTVAQLGLLPLLEQDGHTVHSHTGRPPEEVDAVRRRALGAQCYLSSANAITASGMIVNIDGIGNRVAALCFGPKTVYIIAGRNKIVNGGYSQAVARIKREACPKNARRLGYDSPCARENVCRPQDCPQSMCRIIVAMERAPRLKRTVVLLVDEELGY